MAHRSARKNEWVISNNATNTKEEHIEVCE